MHCDRFIEATHSLFGDLLIAFDEGEEYAFYNFGPQMIYRIGYSTNFTPDIVRQAVENKVDLIVTHHDAWDFVFGMKEELSERVATVLNESVKSWKNSEKRISKVGIITGAGNSTNNILDALKLGCDAYITGEKTLYSVQYAQYIGMNMIVGSHTFTEIFGVRSLVEQIRIKFNHLEIIELSEEHFE